MRYLIKNTGPAMVAVEVGGVTHFLNAKSSQEFSDYPDNANTLRSRRVVIKALPDPVPVIPEAPAVAPLTAAPTVSPKSKQDTIAS